MRPPTAGYVDTSSRPPVMSLPPPPMAPPPQFDTRPGGYVSRDMVIPVLSTCREEQPPGTGWLKAENLAKNLGN